MSADEPQAPEEWVKEIFVALRSGDVHTTERLMDVISRIQVQAYDAGYEAGYDTSEGRNYADRSLEA